MSVEKVLTDELHTVGAAVKAPIPPDAADLARRAVQLRTRTRLRAGATVVLAAAVVLGAIAVGTQVSKPDAAPSPAPQPTELPTGAPPKIPYVKNSALYLGGTVRPGSWTSVIPRGRSALAYLGSTNGSIVLFRDGAEIARIATRRDLAAALSPEGTKAAWIQRDGSTFSMVVYDLTTRHEAGRQPVDSMLLGHVGKETEAWESIGSVSDDGVVSYGGVVVLHTWYPGSIPVTRVTAGAPSDRPTGYPADADQVVVSPDGRWGAWTTDRLGEQEPGSTVTTDQYTVAVTAQKPGQPESTIHFQPPRDSSGGSIDWETDEAFLVTVYDDPDLVSWHYVRCTIATQKCEVAPTPPAR